MSRRNYARCHVDLELGAGVSLSLSGSSQWIRRELPKMLQVIREAKP